MSVATQSLSMLCWVAALLNAQVVSLQGQLDTPVDAILPATFSEVPVHTYMQFSNSTWIPHPELWPDQLTDLAKRHAFFILIVPVFIGFALLLLVLSSLVDWRGCMSIAQSGSTPRRDDAPMQPVESTYLLQPQPSFTEPRLQNWSRFGILCLTSYRFYTGFLGATWMPYLLAMEGSALMGHQQAFFMGTAKLVYGTSIMMNPIFGLVGDQMAVVSHWSGRRVFVLLGVAAGGLGIYGCIVAAQIGSVGWYMLAVVLWMLGEAIADVTTETLVPELLPRSQYDIGSALRAINFLVGGLVGYSTLIAFRHCHHSWLYYGYLLVMLVCAFLTLMFADTQDLETSCPRQKKTSSLGKLVKQAYTLPAQLEGGFPKACLCLFVFSAGSAPMMFLMLMVRDLIGIKEPVAMQLQFSIISVVFFISAALATVVEKFITPSVSEEPTTEAGPEAGAGDCRRQRREAVVLQWRLMVWSIVFFGVVEAAMPVVGLLPHVAFRTVCFYAIGLFYGASFGSVYAHFQECTWSLLPPGVDVANAMGFAAMCKLAGVGLGNFLAGVILDICNSHSFIMGGYFVMCFLGTLLVVLSAKLAAEVGEAALKTFDAK